MSKRPPNELESLLHQAALSTSKKELSAKQAESIVPDPEARQNALNFLLGVGLFKSLTTPRGGIIFRAVSKEEIVATKGLTGEENLVYNHIKISGNEGIWTKHLKAKTSLHQTVIDRCLKTLTQKRLIKRVPSVQHITRKIYMLEGIEPSIALTGGPWYTDNELDTEFIQNLMEACYKLICDVSFPKRRGGNEGTLYPISNAPRYPSAEDIAASLRKARLTETNLTVEHVEMLLHVLILDGKIEKIPSFGAALWNPGATSDEESDVETRKNSRKKKRKYRSDDSDSDSTRARQKRKKGSFTDDDDESRSSARGSHLQAPHTSDSELDRKAKKKKRRLEDDSPQDEGSIRKRKKRRNDTSSESNSSESEASHSKRRKKRASKQRSSSPSFNVNEFDTGSGGSVYRAIKETMAAFSWTESPCGLCPSFEFCKDNGPVNPKECVYYDEWVAGRTMSQDQEIL